jgi:LPXTG-motif cell wall-anchored protein
MGAVTALSGLALSFAALTTSTPVAAAPVDSPICNNQKPDQPNCVGSDLHGTLTAEVQSNGDLSFTVAPEGGFGGWSGVKVCIPGEAMTTAADCTGQDKDTLVSPADYAVSGVTGAVASDVGYSFDCDGSFSMLVDADALRGDATPSYTVHLSPCAGGTDEAFGTAEAFEAPASTTPTSEETTTSTSEATTTTTGATTTTGVTPTTTTGATPTTAAMGGVRSTQELVVEPERLAVLGEELVRPSAAAAPATTAAAPATLPRTGSSSRALLLLGVVLVAFGSVLVLGVNRRRPVPVPVTSRPRR